MPGNLIQTTLAIGGQLLSSLPASFRQASNYLTRLQRQALGTTTAFGGMSRSLLAFGGGYVALSSANSLLTQAINKYKEEANLITNIQLLLKNNTLVQKEGANAYQTQTDEIVKQSKLLQEQTGIHHTIFERGSAILGTFHFSGKAIEEVNSQIQDLIAFQEKMGVSAEEMPKDYEAIGKAVQTGMARPLKAVGIELDDITQRAMHINAQWGNYSANLKIVLDALTKTYGGAAERFRNDPLTKMMYQAAKAQALMLNQIQIMGKPALELQQRFTILFSQLLPEVVPYVTKALESMNEVLKYMGSQMTTKVVPVFREWLAKGWQLILKTIQWFKQNWTWLKELIKWFLLWRLGMTGLGIALWALISPLKQIQIIFTMFGNPFGAAIAGAFALGGAILWVRKHYYQTLDALDTLNDRLFGTPKRFRDTGYVHQRVYPKGVVPRALPVVNFKDSIGYKLREGIKGWLRDIWNDITKWTLQFIDWLGAQFDFVFKWMVELGKGAWKGLLDWYNNEWLAGWKKTSENWQIIIKGMGDWIHDHIQTPLESVKKILDQVGDAWNKFWGQNTHGVMTPGQQGGDAGAFYAGGPGGGGGAQGRWVGTMNYQPGINFTHFGYEKPGQFGYDTRSARGEGAFIKHMVPGYDVALIKQLADIWHLQGGDVFTYMGRKFRYGDVVPQGYWRNGMWHQYRDLRFDVYDPYNQFGDHPFTTRTISSQNQQQKTHLQQTLDAAQKALQNNTNRLNYNDNSTIHVHEANGLQSRYSSIRRRSLQHFREALADATFEVNRRSFGYSNYLG